MRNDRVLDSAESIIPFRRSICNPTLMNIRGGTTGEIKGTCWLLRF